MVLAGICFVYSPRVRAQAGGSSQSTAKGQADIDQNIELLRKDIRSGKKQLLAANLKLTDDQATKFWPVYDQYTAELTKIGDQKTALLKEYAEQWGTISDEQASSLIKRSLSLDEQAKAGRGTGAVKANKALDLHDKLRNATAHAYSHQAVRCGGAFRLWNLHVEYPGAIGAETRKNSALPPGNHRLGRVLPDCLFENTVGTVAVG